MNKLAITLAALLLAPPAWRSPPESVKLDRVPIDVARRCRLAAARRAATSSTIASNCHSASLHALQPAAGPGAHRAADPRQPDLHRRQGRRSHEDRRWTRRTPRSGSGRAPPDLTVIARSRASGDGSGADWLYTYLRGFYRDPTPPDRLEQHGLPERRHAARAVAAAGRAGPEDGDGASPVGPTEARSGEREVHRLVLDKPGKMKPAEYDRMVADLVNYLVYMGEPARHDRETHRHLRAAVPGRDVRARLRAEEGILEGRALIGDS